MNEREKRARRILGMFYDWDKEREVLSKIQIILDILEHLL